MSVNDPLTYVVLIADGVDGFGVGCILERKRRESLSEDVIS